MADTKKGAKKRARFVFNIETGLVGFRTNSTDQLPVIFKLIDDETAAAIERGEVKVSDVQEAIMKAEMTKSGFSWREYDKERTKAKELLNMSQRDMAPVNEEQSSEEQVAEQNEEVLSLKDISSGEAEDAPKGKSSSKGGKSGAKADKPNGEEPAETKDAPKGKGGEEAGAGGEGEGISY